MNTIKKFLYYITNNEESSRHEPMWDMIFFVIETTALVGGTIYAFMTQQEFWVAFLFIEYCWALDQLRHNRL